MAKKLSLLLPPVTSFNRDRILDFLRRDAIFPEDAFRAENRMDEPPGSMQIM